MVVDYLEKAKNLVRTIYDNFREWRGTDEMNSSSIEHNLKRDESPIKHLENFGDQKW